MWHPRLTGEEAQRGALGQAPFPPPAAPGPAPAASRPRPRPLPRRQPPPAPPPPPVAPAPARSVVGSDAVQRPDTGLGSSGAADFSRSPQLRSLGSRIRRDLPPGISPRGPQAATSVSWTVSLLGTQVPPSTLTRCRQNSVPCGCGTEAHVFPLAHGQGHSRATLLLEASGSAQPGGPCHLSDRRVSLSRTPVPVCPALTWLGQAHPHPRGGNDTWSACPGPGSWRPPSTPALLRSLTPLLKESSRVDGGLEWPECLFFKEQPPAGHTGGQ